MEEEVTAEFQPQVRQATGSCVGVYVAVVLQITELEQQLSAAIAQHTTDARAAGDLGEEMYPLL